MSRLGTVGRGVTARIGSWSAASAPGQPWQDAGKAPVGHHDVFADTSSGYLLMQKKAKGGPIIPTYHHKDWGPG